MRPYLLAGLLIVAASLPLAASAATKVASNTVPNATSTEWQYVRPPTDRAFAQEVHARQPYKNEDILKVYLVRNNRLYEDSKWHYNEDTGDLEDVDFKWTKNRTTAEYKIWDIFARIAGKDFVKKNVLGYVTFRDPDTGVLGAVWRADRPKEPSWILGINANGADFGNANWERDMTIVLLHEFGHLVTMNKAQIKYTGKSTCATGMGRTLFGCAYKKSYMTAYLAAFWDAADQKHAASVAGQETGKQAASLVKKYYKAHADDFVSQYAASGPEEDAAESFVNFILEAKPASALKEKERKVLFFYNYPELVALRTSIRTSVASYFTK